MTRFRVQTIIDGGKPSVIFNDQSNLRISTSISRVFCVTHSSSLKIWIPSAMLPILVGVSSYISFLTTIHAFADLYGTNFRIPMSNSRKIRSGRIVLLLQALEKLTLLMPLFIIHTTIHYLTGFEEVLMNRMLSGNCLATISARVLEL